MPPWRNPDRELTCHVSNGGVLCKVAMCAFGGGPYNNIFIASTHDVVFSSNKSNPYIISIIDGSLDSIEATGGSIEGVALEYSWHQPFPLH